MDFEAIIPIMKYFACGRHIIELEEVRGTVNASPDLMQGITTEDVRPTDSASAQLSDSMQGVESEDRSTEDSASDQSDLMQGIESSS